MPLNTHEDDVFMWAPSPATARDRFYKEAKLAEQGIPKDRVYVKATGVLNPAGVNLNLMDMQVWELDDDMEQSDGNNRRRYRVGIR